MLCTCAMLMPYAMLMPCLRYAYARPVAQVGVIYFPPGCFGAARWRRNELAAPDAQNSAHCDHVARRQKHITDCPVVPGGSGEVEASYGY